MDQQNLSEQPKSTNEPRAHLNYSPNELRHRRPEGTLEELLVDKIASLIIVEF
jgi:hypothetical protein